MKLQGAKYGYIWFGSNIICVAFYYLFLPEMKGRSLEELDEMFRERVSVRNFWKYECALTVEAQQSVALSDVKEGAGTLHIDVKR